MKPASQRNNLACLCLLSEIIHHHHQVLPTSRTTTPAPTQVTHCRRQESKTLPQLPCSVAPQDTLMFHVVFLDLPLCFQLPDLLTYLYPPPSPARRQTHMDVRTQISINIVRTMYCTRNKAPFTPLGAQSCTRSTPHLHHSLARDRPGERRGSSGSASTIFDSRTSVEG